MHCTKCGKNIPNDSKFCQSCGNDLTNRKVDIDESSLGFCQVCKAKAPVKYNEFYANIGMLFARRHYSIKGNMCRNCTDKYFWQYFFTNLFLGWWGIISFFATIIYMINNIFRYIFSITLKRYS